MVVFIPSSALNSKYESARAGVDDQRQGLVGLLHHEQIEVLPRDDQPLPPVLQPQLGEIKILHIEAMNT